MNALSGRLFVGGRLVAGTLIYAEGKIERVELDPPGAPATSLSIVAPGFVDLHVHGFGGAEPAGDLAGMARALARRGTTTFQPTLFPRAPERLGAEAAQVARAAEALAGSAEPLARVAGLHLEGPFVNPERAGALPRADLALPSPEGLRALLGPASGGGHLVRTLTLAPELPGAHDLLRELARAGVRASLGHSAARGAEARAAARAGARGVTHLYNAMSGFHHRDAGLVGTAWRAEELAVEIIGDLVHCSREAIEMALALCGPGRLCLVSDALSGAGTGCDVFHANGREHRARDGAAWVAPEAPAGAAAPGAQAGDWQLGGALSSQLESVQRLVRAGVVGLEDALTMAALAPARALGLETSAGALIPGANADLVVLTPALELAAILVGGRPVDLGR